MLLDVVKAALCKYNSDDDPQYWVDRMVEKGDGLMPDGKLPPYWDQRMSVGDGVGKKPCNQTVPAPDPVPVPVPIPSFDFEQAFSNLQVAIAHLQATVDAAQVENKAAFKQLVEFGKRAFPWLK